MFISSTLKKKSMLLLALFFFAPLASLATSVEKKEEDTHSHSKFSDPIIVSKDQEVTPWEVTSKSGINYMKLIKEFGCDPIDGKLIKFFEKLTHVRAHTWLRRGIFFSQKDLKDILVAYQNKELIYLYTGRGPSSDSMHLGHLIPFMFTKYLQDALNAIVIIQMSDDEKFFFKGGHDPSFFNELARKNAHDIIACGFNPNKTYIFSNLKRLGGKLYETSVKIMKSVTGNTIKSIYGLDLSNNIGQFIWPSFQCAPAYYQSFPKIFGKRKAYCLVPMAIDQDPYFRMARDFAYKHRKKGYMKPGTIHTKFLVSLGGVKNKMSSTGNNSNMSAIFLTDNEKQIKRKVNQAFSGGQESLEMHRKKGADLEKDVCFQYLLYFLDDDKQMFDIAKSYSSGKMTTKDIKKITSDVLCKLVMKHQENKKKVMEETIDFFFNENRKFDLSSPKEKGTLSLLDDEEYKKQGVNFDPFFGTLKE